MWQRDLWKSEKGGIVMDEVILKRYENNPILTSKEVGSECNSIFNSAVIPFGDGYVGIFRVDTIGMISELHIGWSRDGIKWDVEPERLTIHCEDCDMMATGGSYDPRITELEACSKISRERFYDF